MNYLLDINVWLPIALPFHPDCEITRCWMDSENQKLIFCRITQLGLLRLLTQKTLMSGKPFTQREAWTVIDDLQQNPRIVFQEEPSNIDVIFRALSSRDEVSPKRWTDDYLIVFATTAQLTFVTFDKALATRAPEALLLTP